MKHLRGESDENFRAKMLADIKRKDKEAKLKTEMDLQQKKERQQRANSYAKYVKEIYKPKQQKTILNDELPPLPKISR